MRRTRATGSARAASDEERILPLINVVFLLLTFFMLAGRLTASDPFEIAPPVSASEGEVDVQDMLVLVSADGRLALDGDQIDERELMRRIAARLEEDDSTHVRLKADGNAEAVRVVAVMEGLREAGVPSVELLTVPAGR